MMAMTKTTACVALAILCMLQSSMAWSVGPFAIRASFTKGRTAAASSQSTSAGATVVSASNEEGLMDQESLIMNARSPQASDALVRSQFAVLASDAAPQTIIVDSTSFTLDDSFRSSTVDLLYHQSMKRAGLE
eukprot:CAMPEP_0198114948 /NCGR_PEP_ID=MMETSP1442-20131203/6185_1 /TAXON_ID= /ORGANISM="Craspedostauros australis, Strain CCMP3328" /LENGTH=132 /DNA_ID=CAMNT_0043772359 /DNA_START=380 /DNA_END=778 /DNA_ORIENTATION=-